MQFTRQPLRQLPKTDRKGRKREIKMKHYKKSTKYKKGSNGGIEEPKNRIRHTENR